MLTIGVAGGRLCIVCCLTGNKEDEQLVHNLGG